MKKSKGAAREMEREVFRLLSKSSGRRLLLIFAILCAAVPAGFLVRHFAFSSILLKDSALSKEIPEGSLLIVCKLGICLENLSQGDVVLFHLNAHAATVRKILALPGDSVKITAAGFVSVNHSQKKLWENESAIIADREFYIPKKGDTLEFGKLSDIEFDYALNALKKQKIPYFVKVIPKVGEQTLSEELSGKTKIGSRPVSLREVPGLPWQELQLIAHQIRMLIHSDVPVRMERTVYSAKDSTKIERIAIRDDMYYLVCERAELCADSREFGYVRASDLIGKNLFSFPAE